jgi:ADP-heptose:LPS heptosyltransferase
MYHDLVKPVTENHTELPEFSIEKLPTKENTVIVHPGVSKISIQKGMIKTISPEKWAEVIKGLINNNKKVILLGGKDDEECINKIVSLIPEGGYENLYGKTKSLKELAQIISSAEKFICSDSAPLHIAVAMRVNTFVIFGSTDDKKLVPQNKEFVKVLKIQSKCPLQPCLWEKRVNTCENLECLDIPIEYIVNALL